jgi:hypothetical protein
VDGRPHTPTLQRRRAAGDAAEPPCRRPSEPPRWLVTSDEFYATSSYMRGRLSPDKVWKGGARRPLQS